MKVLVVGGAGYIGSTLSRQLWQAGHEVTVFDLLLFGGESLLPLLGRPRFQLVKGDIRDRAALAAVMTGHDAVVLLAAIVGEPACNRDPAAAVETNLQGARNVLAATQAAGIPRFVFGSTCSNYGIADVNGLADENAPLKPLSTYSETKVTAEGEILAAAGDAFHPTVLRFSTAFGVSTRMRFDLLVSDFTLAAVRDGKIVIYGEQFWRPFVHVEDISAAIELVLGSDLGLVSGEVFNVGSNSANTRKIDLGELVQHNVQGTNLEFVKCATDPRSYRVDFSKIEDRLGYRAQWSIEDGVREVKSALQAGVWKDPSDSRFYN
jgi:nucleoside-diphosphate-sugar epimerase